MPWSEKQNRLFRAAAHNPSFARKVGIKQSDATRMAHEGIKSNSSGGSVKKRKFADGGEIDGDYGDQTPSTETIKPTSFKEAFAAARAAGDKSFSWRGKDFNTELAKPTPRSKPAAGDSYESQVGEKPRSLGSRLGRPGSTRAGFKKGGFVPFEKAEKETKAFDKKEGKKGEAKEKFKFSAGGAVGRGNGKAQRGLTKGRVC